MPNDVLPPIAYADLFEQLSDPDSDLDHLLQYLIEVPVPGRMGPELQPNPALVTDIPPQVEGGALISLANGFMRRRRHRKYRRRIRGGWTGPRIISEGDSWFQYPTRLQDIIDHLMKDHAILSLGAAGDELSDIRKQREILLNIQAEGANALLLSAGGNDLFDNGQLGRLIEDPFPGATGADLVGPTVETFLQTLVGQYLDLFRRVHHAFPHVHILIHGYGPAFPRNGSWIEKPLTRRGVAKATQHDVVKVILARFNETLASLAKRTEFHGKLTHIDVTDIGTNRDDWHDEIHLDGPNYAKVADRFRQVLKTKLEAATETSVIDFPDLTLGTRHQATTFAAFDQAVLLRELDLRVALLELDPTAADEADMPPLFPSQPEIETGVFSLRRTTRRLIDRWLRDLREVICTDAAPDTALEKTIVDAFAQSKPALAAAIAGWLVTGPLSVPAALGGTLAAWLAGEVLDEGRDQLCALWTPPGSPAVLSGAAAETSVTVGEMRKRFRTPSGEASFDADERKDRLAILDAALAEKVVEPPQVPVDADGAKKFRLNAARILEMLGGEQADVPIDPTGENTAEALILTDGTRPSVYVRDGDLDLNDPLLEQSGWLDEIGQAKDDILGLINASGRIIEGADRSANSVYGSAWMLPGGRVATAQHVLEGMCIQVGDRWHLKSTFFVDFSVEADRPVNPDAVWRIDSVDFASPDVINQTVHPPQLDAAVFKLAPRDGFDFPNPVPLANEADGTKILTSDRFFNVGHPAAPRGPWLVDTDDGNPNTIARALVHALIGDRFGVKRLSPGMIDFQPGKFPEDEATKHVITHDATTLGGSSGSALMAQGTDGAVTVGLHFAGRFGTRNYAHWVPAIRESLQ